jgi:hypothetical protein
MATGRGSSSEKITMSEGGGTPKKSLDKSESAYEMCNREVLYHGFLCFAAIVVIVTQGTVLNFYIIAFYREYYHQVSFLRSIICCKRSHLMACH